MCSAVIKRQQSGENISFCLQLSYLNPEAAHHSPNSLTGSVVDIFLSFSLHVNLSRRAGVHKVRNRLTVVLFPTELSYQNLNLIARLSKRQSIQAQRISAGKKLYWRQLLRLLACGGCCFSGAYVMAHIFSSSSFLSPLNSLFL